MTAFNALEQRLLNLSLADRQDVAEASVVVGLFTSQPSEAHDGKYGQHGEPAALGPGSNPYKRAVTRFGQAAVVEGVTRSVNTEAVTLTGLPAGTYTHFGVFGGTG